MPKRRLGLGVAALLVALVVVADVAHAKITLRPRSPHDNFFFHGNYSTQPFDPNSAFGIELWNCANGVLPAFIADRVPLIVCGYDPVTGYVLGERVYEVSLPGEACHDHGRSCYFRNPAAASAGGVRFLRVQYARRGHGNRVWFESFGDLSAAQQANMLILITVDGAPRAALQDTFTPLPNGGWFSPF
ncbi:MAG: hypothetical protein ABIR79_23260 [Candidatus Binatia bacterium]